MSLVCMGDGMKSARQQNIIAVHPTHESAGSPGEALHECIGLTKIRTAVPVGELGGVTLDDIQASVGAAAVDDDQLQPGVSLSYDRADSLLQVRLLVEGWHHDGQFGEGITLQVRALVYLAFLFSHRTLPLGHRLLNWTMEGTTIPEPA